MKNKICTQCNRTFKPSSGHLKCPICRAQKTICPCGNQKNRQSTHCLPCHKKSNKKPSGWVGNPYKNYDGYIKRRVVDHPSGSRYIFEHRLVMEGILGRFLLGNETVHHLNGVKDDNRPENLELWVTKQPCGQRAEDLIRWANEILDTYSSYSTSNNNQR